MAMPPTANKMVSIVVPCYNEAMGLDAFFERAGGIAGGLPQYNFEFVFVDDGSQDETEALLARHARQDPQVKVLCLARNYGHQRAVTAGLDACAGDFAIVLDADLQDPPELIPAILEKLEAGFDVVHTVRTDRRVDPFPKRFTARLFYMVMRRWVMPALPENAGDFKGLNRRAVEALRLYRERMRFLRGLLATLGFKQTEVHYVRAARHAGDSKYPIRSVLRLARDAVVSNTALPLRLSFYLGALTCASLPVFLVASLHRRLYGGGLQEPLLVALMALVIGFSGVILVMLGLVGEYLKCIILEVKQRPLYLVRARHNLEDPAPPKP